MKKKVVDIQEYVEENTPHVVSELICLKCLHRVICVYPEGLWLKDMECSECGHVGAMIHTGQELGDKDSLDVP